MQTGFASIIFGTIFLATVAACGGSDLDPGAGDAAGTGTQTLTINGGAHAQPRLVNARERTDFETDVDVRITLNGQTVTTGTVAVTTAAGKTALTFHPDMHWSATIAGYDEVYVLDVVSGTDKVEGVRVDGPDIHVFSAPTEGQTVDATMPLMLKWDRSDTADSATLRAENLDSVAIADSGSYSLAPGALKTDQTQARPNTLRLTRTNRVVPTGAVTGSSWSVAIDNSIDVVAQPQP